MAKTKKDASAAPAPPEKATTPKSEDLSSVKPYPDLGASFWKGLIAVNEAELTEFFRKAIRGARDSSGFPSLSAWKRITGRDWK